MAATSKRLRIFIVESHPAPRDLLTSFLPTLGHWVESSGDAGTALERLRQGGFDVLLTDLWQPGPYGWCLLDELRARGDLPSCVVSTGGDVRPDTVQLSREAGCCFHLEQPFRLSEVEQILEAVRVRVGPSCTTRRSKAAEVASCSPGAVLHARFVQVQTESRLLCAIVARRIASCRETVEEARKTYEQCRKQCLS